METTNKSQVQTATVRERHVVMIGSGYFIADDKGPARLLKNAAEFPTFADAKREANLVRKTWNTTAHVRAVTIKV